MKKFLAIVVLCVFPFLASGSELLKTTADKGLKVLDLVLDVKIVYSKASELEAKMIELMAGDGKNPSRIILVLSSGNPMDGSKIFELGKSVSKATRITFLSKDVIVINYMQDLINENGSESSEKKSLKVEVLREKDGHLKEEIKISPI